MKTNTMKAAVASGYGDPSVYSVKQVNIPSPADDQILVRVHASSVTRADTMIRTGKPLFGRLMLGLFKPKSPIPGTGFAGVIEKVGSSVKRFSKGDQVFGETTLGFSTNAEFVCVSEKGVVLTMPENMSFSEACTITDGPLTSYNFLKELAQIQPGDKVLINGASGSLGTAAIQIAKNMGAEVTGVCSNRNIGLVTSLGADHAIDYTREDFTKSDEKYDFIYDTVGKSSFKKCANVLSDKGKYLSPVLGWPLLFDMIKTARSSNKKAIFAATGMKPEDKLLSMLEEVTEQFVDGKLTTVIDRQYPLEKIREAHTYVDSDRKKGSVVIVFNN